MCDQTQGLPAQQIAPDSPVPFRSRETTAFPHFARMQSKCLRKRADEEGKKAIRLLRPKEKAVGLSWTYGQKNAARPPTPLVGYTSDSRRGPSPARPTL